MRLQGDRLSVDELSILKNRTPALDVGALNVHISNFTETDTSSLYAASLSDLAIQSDALILRNYQLTERKTERSFNPTMPEENRQKLYKIWQKAVEKTRAWLED